MNKFTWKGFGKSFLIYFIVATLVLIPVQIALDKLGGIRLFAGTESLGDIGILVDENSPFYTQFKKSKRVNILCLGLNDNLSDTIMLVSYDMKNQHIDIISVPRDTYYHRDGYSGAYLKINSIYHSEGAVGTAKAVSDLLLGMPINYYAVIGQDGVGRIVEGIGGVRVHADFHMHYEDPFDTPPLYIDFPEGDHVLNGEDAIAFLRFRKPSGNYSGYPQGDIGRVAKHQEFMKSAFKSALDTGVVKTVKLVLENVDSDITLGMATKIAGKAAFAGGDAIETYLLPGNSKTINGLSYWQAHSTEINDLIETIYGSSEEDQGEKTGNDGKTDGE